MMIVSEHEIYNDKGFKILYESIDSVSASSLFYVKNSSDSICAKLEKIREIANNSLIKKASNLKASALLGLRYEIKDGEIDGVKYFLISATASAVKFID